MDSISFITSPLNVARAASALDQIVSCAGWLRLFVVKKSIQGKRVHWTRFLIRSCSAGCLIRSGCVCTWWLCQDQIMSSTWWRTWSDRAASALDQIVLAMAHLIRSCSLWKKSIQGKRVQRTRFPCMEDEFNELVFPCIFLNADTGK